MHDGKAPPRFEALKRGSCVICLVKRVKALDISGCLSCLFHLRHIEWRDLQFISAEDMRYGKRFVDQDPRLE